MAMSATVNNGNRRVGLSSWMGINDAGVITWRAIYRAIPQRNEGDMGDRAPMIGQFRDTLRKASKVVDAPRRRTEEAVRKIAERPNFDLMEAPQLAWELVQKGLEQAGKAKGVLDAQVRRRLNEMGLATQDEIEALRRRVVALEAAVAARPTPAPAAGTGPSEAEIPKPP